MNLLDHHVLKVLSEPEKVVRDWGVYWKKEVFVDCHGCKEAQTVTASTKEGIDAYVVGYVYEA